MFKTIYTTCIEIIFLGFPPPESREKTFSILGGHEYLGLDTTSSDYLRIQELEKEAVDSFFVILSTDI